MSEITLNQKQWNVLTKTRETRADGGVLSCIGFWPSTGSFASTDRYIVATYGEKPEGAPEVVIPKDAIDWMTNQFKGTRNSNLNVEIVNDEDANLITVTVGPASASFFPERREFPPLFQLFPDPPKDPQIGPRLGFSSHVWRKLASFTQNENFTLESTADNSAGTQAKMLTGEIHGVTIGVMPIRQPRRNDNE